MSKLTKILSEGIFSRENQTYHLLGLLGVYRTKNVVAKDLEKTCMPQNFTGIVVSHDVTWRGLHAKFKSRKQLTLLKSHTANLLHIINQ